MFNKIILIAIAGGLWANAAAQWTRPAYAQSSIETYLSQIAGSTRALATGGAGCLNTKICD